MKVKARERAVMKRRLRLARHLGLISADSSAGAKSGGHFRKRAPLDCGNRCFLCHGEKLWGKATLAERKAREAFRCELIEQGV